MHLSIPYHFIQTFIYHNTITILLQCGQHIRHLSAEYAGHTPILRYRVTYHIPADKPVSRISCRFGSFDPNRQAVPHPGPHVPTALIVLTFLFATVPHPPINPKYTKFKNVVRPCATSTDLLKAAQLLCVTIFMTTFTGKKGKKRRNDFPKSVSINYNIKSADKVPESQYFYLT